MHTLTSPQPFFDRSHWQEIGWIQRAIDKNPLHGSGPAVELLVHVCSAARPPEPPREPQRRLRRRHGGALGAHSTTPAEAPAPEEHLGSARTLPERG